MTAPLDLLTDVTDHGSLYCKVIGMELTQAVLRYRSGDLTKEACEALIGQCTDGRIARELAGDDREIRLAISEELDALRSHAVRLLDSPAAN